MSTQMFFEDSRAIFKKKHIASLVEDIEFREYIDETFLNQNILNNNFISSDILYEKLKNIWHTVAGVQIQLANFLIFSAQIDYKNPSNENNELTKNLSYHHLSMTYESIYRAWEKVTQVLYYLHYREINKTIYYNGIVEVINNCKKYDTTATGQLKKHIYHWNKIAEIRNKYSHEQSKIFIYDLHQSKILNEYGFPFIHERNSLKFKEETSSIINRYNYLKKLNSSLRNFINIFPITPIISINKL